MSLGKNRLDGAALAAKKVVGSNRGVAHCAWAIQSRLFGFNSGFDMSTSTDISQYVDEPRNRDVARLGVVAFGVSLTLHVVVLAGLLLSAPAVGRTASADTYVLPSDLTGLQVLLGFAAFIGFYALAVAAVAYFYGCPWYEAVGWVGLGLFTALLAVIAVFLLAMVASGRYRSTLRPLNRCQSCGRTWFPRGTNVSMQCPTCGSTAVGLG